MSRTKSARDDLSSHSEDLALTPERRAVLERVKSFDKSKSSPSRVQEDVSSPEHVGRSRRVTLGDRPVLRYFNVNNAPAPLLEVEEPKQQARVSSNLYFFSRLD